MKRRAKELKNTTHTYGFHSLINQVNLEKITTLLGSHKLNISSVEMKEKTKEYINFRFNLIIRDLKNFTNFISELKQKDIKFKIIRHEEKRNAFTQKIFKYFKKN